MPKVASSSNPLRFALGHLVLVIACTDPLYAYVRREGHRLFLPGDPKYWPEPTHLAWHRRNKFTSSSEACCPEGDLSMSSG